MQGKGVEVENRRSHRCVLSGDWAAQLNCPQPPSGTPLDHQGGTRTLQQRTITWPRALPDRAIQYKTNKHHRHRTAKRLDREWESSCQMSLQSHRTPGLGQASSSELAHSALQTTTMPWSALPTVLVSCVHWSQNRCTEPEMFFGTASQRQRRPESRAGDTRHAHLGF